jgi:polysaccharide pyruvyl transferase WcaK-like protein
MRIAYYIDNSKAVNWGGQAMFAGISHLVKTSYPDAEFVPLKFRKLPLRSLPFLRFIPDHILCHCVKRGRLDLLKTVLHWYGIPKDLYEKFDVVCFNGEGAIHEKSGHFFRLVCSLHAFKLGGKRVYSLYQTIDVEPGGIRARLLQSVYPLLDRVEVREPVSLRMLEQLGIVGELGGDAAYAMPRISDDERRELSAPYGLEKPFIAVTASSALERNPSSVAVMDRLLNALSVFNREIVFLANTKTDLFLAEKLTARHRFRVIDYDQAKFREAISIISMAELIVGGRQHPNIFAAEYGVPFIGLSGNTHKMRGVVEILNYPVPVLSWDFQQEELVEMARRILDGEVDFSKVSVSRPLGIDLGPAV